MKEQVEPIPVADWRAQAVARFGSSPDKWAFQCPACGHIQTAEDFKAIGQEPQSVYVECIGRHMPKAERARDLGSTPAANGNKSPCDYAAYGLLRLGAQVKAESGEIITVFPFAPVATGEGSSEVLGRKEGK
jgi:hypothetical protein